jgi:hypothetical protein
MRTIDINPLRGKRWGWLVFLLILIPYGESVARRAYISIEKTMNKATIAHRAYISIEKTMNETTIARRAYISIENEITTQQLPVGHQYQ